MLTLSDLTYEVFQNTFISQFREVVDVLFAQRRRFDGTHQKSVDETIFRLCQRLKNFDEGERLRNTSPSAVNRSSAGMTSLPDWIKLLITDLTPALSRWHWSFPLQGSLHQTSRALSISPQGNRYPFSSLINFCFSIHGLYLLSRSSKHFLQVFNNISIKD